MSLAAPHSPKGASGEPLALPPDCPKRGIGLCRACGVEFDYIANDARLFCFFGSENRWGWATPVQFTQYFRRDVGMLGYDFAGKLDVAIEALQGFRDAVAHLATVESPIVGMKEESGEGGAGSSFSSQEHRQS